MGKKIKRVASRLRSLFRLKDSVHSLVSGKEDIAELALRRAMASRRNFIRKRAGAYSADHSVRKSAQRFARDKARKLKKAFIKKRSWAIPKHLLLQKRSESTILDKLDQSRASAWRPLVARRYKKELLRLKLEDMNFLDSPIETINQLVKLSRAESSELAAYLDFNDQHCLDIGAYLVLAEVWPQLTKVFRGGRMSLPVQKVLSAIHLDRDLQIGLPGVSDHQDVWAFPLKRRRPRGTTMSPSANLQPQDREKVADQLCDLVDKWFDVAFEEIPEDGATGWELSLDGRSLIMRMTGELLCNAERHSVPSSSDGDWSMTAFMAARQNEQGNRELRCYMAFLSVGQSIAESMANAANDLLEIAEPYLTRFASDKLSRDTLMTVVALQDAVTSDQDARENGRGGTGLQDILELVSDLGASHSDSADLRVTIVSGKSCIRLRHPYLVGERDDSGRRVQWCNRENTSKVAPSAETAFDLPAHFAGTLVSAAFTLDPRLYVTEGLDDGDCN